MADGQHDKQHWVDELFPPTFSYSSSELLQKGMKDEAINGQSKKQCPSVYDIVARR